jgi:hypothetical protein
VKVESVAGAATTDAGDKAAVARQQLRSSFVTRTRALLASLPKQPSAEELENQRAAQLEPLVSECSEARALAEGVPEATVAIAAIAEDIKGQLTEALSKSEWYAKWGAHYLRSLSGAHALQRRNNFKDPGVQHYCEGALVSSLRDMADDCFVAMPPPKPSVAASRSRGRHAAGPPPSMSAYMNRGAPCIAGS